MLVNISKNSQEKTWARVSFLIELQVESCSVINKETQVEVFSSEFCEIFKNNFFYGTPPGAASNIRVENNPFRQGSNFLVKLTSNMSP